jgi:hypothetical protein
VTVPERGKAVAFALIRPMDIGFTRILGTVERAVRKGGGRVRPLVAEGVPGGVATHDISQQSTASSS